MQAIKIKRKLQQAAVKINKLEAGASKEALVAPVANAIREASVFENVGLQLAVRLSTAGLQMLPHAAFR